MPAETPSADSVLAQLGRLDHALCDPDANVDALVADVAGLDAAVRAGAPTWSPADGQRVLLRFNAVMALAIERKATVLSAIEHQTSGRRAVARYQGR